MPNNIHLNDHSEKNKGNRVSVLPELHTSVYSTWEAQPCTLLLWTGSSAKRI